MQKTSFTRRIIGVWVEPLFFDLLSMNHFAWAVFSEGVSHGSAQDPKPS